jgi:hypothetical protein
VTRRTTAATLRRYRAEWRAALARRDYSKTRTILVAALAAVSREAAEDVAAETAALHELLAVDRRLDAICAGEAPARLPPAKQAFAAPSTKRFHDAWLQAIDGADYILASRVVRDAIAALSRHFAKRTRSQQAVIARLKRLQHAPLEFSPAPRRCSFCRGTSQPGVDSGSLFICTDCIQKACEIVAERTSRDQARGAT